MSSEGAQRDPVPVSMPMEMPERVRAALEPVLSFREVSAVEIYDTIREALALATEVEGRQR